MSSASSQLKSRVKAPTTGTSARPTVACGVEVPRRSTGKSPSEGEEQPDRQQNGKAQATDGARAPQGRKPCGRSGAAALLTQQQTRDQVAGEDEEDVDAEPATRQEAAVRGEEAPRGGDVVEQDEQDGDPADAVQAQVATLGPTGFWHSASIGTGRQAPK